MAGCIRCEDVIVDPGAAAGLLGTDTMKDDVRNYLKDAGLECTLAPSSSTVSGIDGKTDPSLAVATCLSEFLEFEISRSRQT